MKKALIIITILVILATALLAGSAGGDDEQTYHTKAATAWDSVGKTVRVILYVLGVGLAIVLVMIGYSLGLRLWARTMTARQDVADRRVREVWPDASGQYPLLWDGKIALDPNRGVTFDLHGVRTLTSAVTQPEQLARILRAARGWPRVEKAGGHLLAKPEAAAIHWPVRVPLTGILDGPASFLSLALGVTMLPDGRSEVVRAGMASMVHIAVGGSSGWGKSVFLRAMAYQLAQSAPPVDLALVDLEAATFAPFATCDRLLWPIADTEADALAIFSELASELDRRKSLFARFPGVDSLSAYNSQIAEPLPPVVCLIDEATALLSHNSVQNTLRTLALRGRKFGLWLCMGGQDWKAASLDTAIRNQLSTRVQFRAMSASQSRVLLQQAGAENLDTKGRALAWLPGRDLLQLQAPWISRGDILASMGSNGGPRLAMPELPTADDQDGDGTRVRRILEMAAQGESKRQICLEVFGYSGGRAFDEVSKILLNSTTTTGPPGSAQSDDTGGECSSSTTTKESSRR